MKNNLVAILNAKPADLTVRDHLLINGAAAIAVVTPFVALVAVEKVREVKAKRHAKKFPANARLTEI